MMMMMMLHVGRAAASSLATDATRVMVALPSAAAAAEEAEAHAREATRLRRRVQELEAELELATAAAVALPGSRRRQLAVGSDAAFVTTVFSMGTEVSLFVVSTVMLAIIALTVVVEKLVHWSHQIPEAYTPLVTKLEEEFMIMGFVSFILVVVEVTAGITHDMLLNIEFAHLMLFFAAVSLVVFALRTLTSMGACQQHWDRLERSDRFKAVAAFEAQTHESQHSIHIAQRFVLSIFLPFREFDAKESAEHLIMRKVFCDKFRLHETGDRGVQARTHRRRSAAAPPEQPRTSRPHSLRNPMPPPPMPPHPISTPLRRRSSRDTPCARWRSSTSPSICASR